MGSLLLLVSLALAPARTAEFDQDHKLWTDVLSACVRGNGFDYRKLKEDRAKLDAYLGSLETVMPEELAGWKPAQQFAFWIDAFNAYTVKRVVDAYPIASILDLGDDRHSVWDQEFVPLGRLLPEAGDRKLTLNDIENKILRPRFKDARVHAAIHRASRSSPPLLAEAFVADKLERQLDAQVERWLGDPELNRFDKRSSTVSVSKIFDRCKDDFVREADSVRRWLEKHAPAAEREWLSSAKELKIEFLADSWKLNDAR
jgi:Protein of unknown function, DUF547